MNPIKLHMPIPRDGCCTFPFFTTIGTSLGLLPTYPLWSLPEKSGDWTGPTIIPYIKAGGGARQDGSRTILYAIPNPFGDRTLPTIYVGGAPENFMARNPIEQYLQAFKYLSWPEQLKMYQVAGSGGREILSTSGVCPQFSMLTPAHLLYLA